MNNRNFIYYVLSLLIVVACQESNENDVGDYKIQQPANPSDKADRLLGIIPTESNEGFEKSFAEAQKAGLQLVELNLDWNYFEPTENNYQDTLGILQAIYFYGANNVKVGLSIASINTVKRTEPEYLKSKSFDDPDYITAYNNLIDWIMTNKADNVEIEYISVGNEVDVYLPDNEWLPYMVFANQTIDHIHTNYPGIKTGVKVTAMNGLLGQDVDHVKKIIALSDVAMLTYYPQNENSEVLDPSISLTHLDQITAAINKDIYFTEVGYQSGSKYCKSSEAKQAQFYHTLFKAWDDHKNQIKLFTINWLHDSPEEKVKDLEAYYGISDPAFLEFLSTLGLRNYDHTDKVAWQQIIVDSNARNWK